MGWLFCSGWTRKSLIAERIASFKNEHTELGRVDSVSLAHCFRGCPWSGVLWQVRENKWTNKAGEVVKSERWIACDLLKCIGGEWGYKDLEESMGPCEKSCPLGYLDMVPVPDSPHAADWREGVRAYHARQAERRIERAKLRKLAGLCLVLSLVGCAGARYEVGYRAPVNAPAEGAIVAGLSGVVR